MSPHHQAIRDYSLNNGVYNSNTNRWLSPDTIVPDPANPQSFNRYSYGYNNPVNFSDPSGHCPSPTGEWAEANIICVAGFIPTATSTGIPGLVYFQGDNRDFSSDSPQDASRFWLWIDVDTGEIVQSFAHPTQRVSGPNGDPIGNPSSPRNESQNNWVTELLLGSNSFSSTLNEDGSITLDYHVVCSDPICNNGLAPNGSITFWPNEYGSFNTTGTVNAFPNLEAYHWQDGELQNNYLFRVQSFSAEERQNGHAEWYTSGGMALSVSFRATYSSPFRVEGTWDWTWFWD